MFIRLTTASRRVALAGLLALAATGTAWADDIEPVVAAPKIIEALSKDIVIDRPGTLRPARAGGATAARSDPSIALRVSFAFGSADLLAQGRRQLDELAMALNHVALSGADFELAGHTDAVGDAPSNLRLSVDRANAVRGYLVQVHGLAPARLQAVGYGFSRLANASNPTSAVNRRVEVRRLAATHPSSPVTGGRLVPTPN